MVDSELGFSYSCTLIMNSSLVRSLNIVICDKILLICDSIVVHSYDKMKVYGMITVRLTIFSQKLMESFQGILGRKSLG